MLVIRFLRVGKKNQPSFQIVVAEKGKAPRSGRFIEKVGFYSPLTKKKGLNAERIKHWLSVGAQPSDTVWNLLVSNGISEGKKKAVHKKSKKQTEAKAAGAPKPEEAASAPKAETKAEPAKEEEKPKEAAAEKPVEAPEEKPAEPEQKPE